MNLLEKSLPDDVKELQEEVLFLRSKLAKVAGFLEFVENDPDPSHTLRGPLVSVKSFLGILDMMEYRVEPDDIQELAVDVNTSVDGLLELVQKLFRKE